MKGTSYILAKVSNPDKGHSGYTDRSRDIEAFLNQRRADKVQRMQQKSASHSNASAQNAKSKP